MTKTTKNASVNSVFATLKRARTLNMYDADARCTNDVKIVAESEKSYKTADNRVIKKADYEKVATKNTIDYRFVTDEDDCKYNRIQRQLITALQLDSNTDMRICRELFNVYELTRSIAITTTYSTILNRAKCFEVMLSEHDYNACKDVFTCEIFSCANRDKYKNKIQKTETYEDIMTLKITNREELNKFNELVSK